MLTRKMKLCLVVMVFLSISGFSQASEIWINFNEFTQDPYGGFIYTTETTAQIYHEGVLSNDPYTYGESGIPIPTGVQSIGFNYSFWHGQDYYSSAFAVSIYNGDTGDYLGGLEGDETGSGYFELDLRGMDLVANLLGLEVDLAEYNVEMTFDETSSVLEINDLKFTVSDTSAIPEPTSFLLFGFGLLAYCKFGRKLN